MVSLSHDCCCVTGVSIASLALIDANGTRGLMFDFLITSFLVFRCGTFTTSATLHLISMWNALSTDYGEMILCPQPCGDVFKTTSDLNIGSGSFFAKWPCGKTRALRSRNHSSCTRNIGQRRKDKRGPVIFIHFCIFKFELDELPGIMNSKGLVIEKEKP